MIADLVVSFTIVTDDVMVTVPPPLAWAAGSAWCRT